MSYFAKWTQVGFPNSLGCVWRFVSLCPDLVRRCLFVLWVTALTTMRGCSFEFLTASDKWLYRALHRLSAVVLALIIFSAPLLFRFYQLNRSVHFQLELQFHRPILISVSVWHCCYGTAFSRKVSHLIWLEICIFMGRHKGSASEY